MKKAKENVSGILCKAALRIAHKTVENEGKMPICTIIIHQPKIPEGLKQKSKGSEKVYENSDM